MREAVVVAREERAGEPQLVAYVVAAQEAQEAQLAATLRAHLAGQLPDYMVPAAFVPLGGAAADGQRQAGPAGAACAAGRCVCAAGLRGAARGARDGAGAAVGGAAGSGAGRSA
ncbi:AMP-binding enzyme [Paraburkholderia youngii]|uniref:AMP-binding enzyme n=1 Tax=Paraburkholderia youngii TaxID=2782701 RepID=UPI00406BAA4A